MENECCRSRATEPFLEGSPSVRPALLWEPVAGAVRCLTCERRCVLGSDQTGWCGTRANREGTLYTLTYGLVSSLSANPIEKKPLYHFNPGTVALTAGSYSCNFACPWCQNWHISKAAPPEQASYLPPQRFVEMALKQRCAGTSISFNEPTLSLEWSLEVFRAARKRGLYNTYVTNGYMTAQALRELVTAGLNAMNVDIKGDTQAVRDYCGADVEVVWRNSLLARELNVHLEITTLVIPGVNDQDHVLRHIAGRIASELGSQVPWHVTGYLPAYHCHTPSTPLATLVRACEIGQDAGLDYVYLGNVPGHELQNTVCPSCGTLLVRRSGMHMSACHLTDGRCPRCERLIPGVWRSAGLNGSESRWRGASLPKL